MRVFAVVLGALGGLVAFLLVSSVVARAVVGPDAGVGAEFGASLIFLPVALLGLPLCAVLGGRLGLAAHDRLGRGSDTVPSARREP